MERFTFFGIFVLCIMCLPLEMSIGEEPARVTPAVKVIDKIQAAMVPVVLLDSRRSISYRFGNCDTSRWIYPDRRPCDSGMAGCRADGARTL